MSTRELVNEFSWSKSRHGKFEECLRLYWFHYYGSWGGWKENAPAEVREAYVLKNLSSRHQWVGHVVHDQIKAALSAVSSGEPPPLERLVEETRDRMRQEFRGSRGGRYRVAPKKVLGLVEHEFAEPVSDEEWRAAWALAERCLTGFYQSPWLARARALARKDWLPIDQIDSFPLDGIKVFAGPDFAFRDGDQVVLVDWKTGRPRSEDADQVRGYALFAAAKWGARTERVRARLVYLGQGSESEVSVDEAALVGFRALFQDSVSRMKKRLKDPERNVADREDFPLTDDRARCRGCSFRRLCGRDGTAAH